MKPGVIFALYDDGTSIRSNDLFKGGPPYERGVMEKSALAALLRNIGSKGYAKSPALNRPYFGPDASYHAIYVRCADDVLYMRSWHEYYDNPRNVVTSRGIETLGSRDRAQVLKADTREYRDFRAAWSYTKQALLDSAPEDKMSFASGIEVEGWSGIVIRLPNSS
jgi:hypothetical protein